jgi:hypothetical protein
MYVEQLRRQAIKNQQDKIENQKRYQTKVDSMSKSNVGGMFDLRSIKNAQSKKVIQEKYYDQDRVTEKFESFLGHHGLYKVRGIIEDKIKKSNGGDLSVFGTEEEIKYLDDVLTEKEKQFSK